jgi:hypothetical protein
MFMPARGFDSAAHPGEPIQPQVIDKQKLMVTFSAENEFFQSLQCAGQLEGYR